MTTNPIIRIDHDVARQRLESITSDRDVDDAFPAALRRRRISLDRLFLGADKPLIEKEGSS